MINCKKLLAMFLIFTLTFSNFAFAANGFVSLFGNSKKNDNVEFSAYLENGEETSTALASDVNNENLAIKMQLNVKESGYLKDGQIEIVAKDGEDLNFKIKSENTEDKEDFEKIDTDETSLEESDKKDEEVSKEEILENESEEISEDSENKIQSLEDNIITLKKIESSDDEIEISLPIEYSQEKYINESKLFATSKVILTGTYVDKDGDENEISEEIELTLAWKDEKEVRVNTDVTKYVQFGTDGIILQTMVKVDSLTDKNSLPVKSTELNVYVPEINEIAPTEITVLANTTEGTNGKGVGEVEFSKDNWSYNEDEKKITINVENKKELVKVNQTEDYLKEDEEEKEEERYYSASGIDEYLITYVYRNIEKADEITVKTKADANVTIFSGVDLENNEVVVSNKDEKEFTLTGQTGNIVSYDIENKTENVSKIYGYLGNETEFDSKTSINVSLTDLVEEMIIEDVQNYYVDKSQNSVPTEDIYYKEVSISKENFDEILGEAGSIEILNQDGNVLATFNKDVETDENGDYKFGFEERISKIAIKTSAPVQTGNLIFSSKKAMSNISVDKNEFANMQEIATDTVQKTKLEYVSELAELDKNTVKTTLDDTKTNFNLIIDRNNLSTVTTNSDVEMRLEFNNDEETSDIYGNSVFEVEMPKYVTNLEVTNSNIVNGEGLELSNVETYERDGKKIIKMTVNGEQISINSGVLTNGTNIVLNMNIDVDMYTPSKDDTITVYGYNSKATNYVDTATYTINDVTTCGIDELDIEYSGPSGVVAINSLSNYSDEGKTLTSIKEGSKLDYLEIYAPERLAKSEIVVINNNDTAVSNFAILGRIPFKGVKDIDSDNEIGTTIDTTLANLISSNESNNGQFTIYYSQNEEATRNLEDEDNNWVTNPENLEFVKSYLIVPSNSDYEFGAKEVLRFSYDYKIPENLDHNEKIYGTFLAYYDNQGMEEASRPDIVGLSTGAGPELDLEVKTDKEQVKELDEFTITAKVTNSGEDLANDVKLIVPVPNGTTYVSAKSDRDSAEITHENGEVVASMVRLEKDASVEVAVTVKVNQVNNEEENKIEISAKANAQNLRKEKTVSGSDVKLITSELILKQKMNYAYPKSIFSKNYNLDFIIDAKNPTNDDKKNVKIVTQLPKELEFKRSAFLEDYNKNFNYKEVESGTYDSSTNSITWNLDTLKANETESLYFQVVVGELGDGVTSKTVEISSKVNADNTDTYSAKNIEVNLGKANLSITQTSSTPTYVTEGDKINYTFTIKNEGGISSGDIALTDIIPEGLVVKSIEYKDENVSAEMSSNEKAVKTINVPRNSEVEVEVEAVALKLDGTKEQTVTNEGSITDIEGNEIKSNSVTHIITEDEYLRQLLSTGTVTESEINGTSNDTTNKSDITKSYKITGTAWLDTNKNGMRDQDEEKMRGITAMLVDSSSGVIKSTTTTDSNGEYTFAGLQNGSYLVIFKYDTKIYATTAYKKEGVETSLNSDVVATRIEQDGKTEVAAVTDTITINGANVTEIDIGLTDATKFSLGLNKSITKITVQNEQGTKTQKYDKAKLAKYEIRSKYIVGSTVYVEYTYTITNNGDLAGYATEIVDYIPEGMTFNSSLNKDWYTGTDGNLYTKALENKELNVGESKEITLVLTKQMTEDNAGLVSNTAEIASDFNIYGTSDINSTPGNKAQNEDDISTADLIISVGTGEVLIYISAIIVSLLLASGIGFIAYRRLIENKRKGGV